MHLTRASIENFRGIGSLDLSLDGVTVIIGENNQGKTSVFDALEICLGRVGGGAPGTFRARDFHRPAEGETGPVGAIRVMLTFEPETEDGPLGADEAPLESALRRGEDGRRRLRVEFCGRVAGAEIECRFVDEERRPLRPQPSVSAVTRLRTLHPMLPVRLSYREPGAASDDESASGRRAPPEPDEFHREEAEIQYVYHELSETRGPVPAETLRRGLRAALRLYERTRRSYPSARGPLRRMLDQLAAEPETFGGGSHSLSLLLVLGALLQVWGDEGLPPAAHPIIAIEEPEAHLHPILLASTWDVIEGLHAQTLITTNSGEFLSAVPLRYLRRLTRRDGRVEAHRMREDGFSADDRRRIGYHIRAKRGGVLFARCWLLVEGESEFWLLHDLAGTLGYDLASEGVRVLEFAQCGVGPLVTLADHLGIAWHLLADGDDSGRSYAREAVRHLAGRTEAEHVTRLRHHDIERTLWHSGFADIYRKAAGLGEEDPRGPTGRRRRPGAVIARAVRAQSKPRLALAVAEACAERGPDSVPDVLRRVIARAVELARDAVDGTGIPAD